MSESYDFERDWLVKFSRCLEQVAGTELLEEIMAGSEWLSSHSSHEEVIAWSRRAMDLLDSRLEEDKRQDILLGCACQFPKSTLLTMKEAYAATGDVDLVHQMLQEEFEWFLTHTLQLGGDLVAEIVRRGWGTAGVKEGNRIIATKIPKSGFLVEYLHETDAEKKRQYYCHCPRVREVLKTPDRLSPTYCYCGAGFYKGIWEEILQKPVRVEVLESVLQGDEVCKIAIYLPLDG